MSKIFVKVNPLDIYLDMTIGNFMWEEMTLLEQTKARDLARKELAAIRAALAEREKRIAELENFVCYCCRENGCQAGCMCNRNPDESE